VNLTLTDEPWGGELAETLRAELEAELLERYGQDSEPGDKPTVEDVEVFLVARDADGDPLGCGALCARAPGSGELKRMFVRPHARGRGIGRALLDALEEAALDRGVAVLSLETGGSQPEAIALYTAAGYAGVPCWGAYAGALGSRCFEKRLAGDED
jgi:putative acetyltransferase